GPIRHAIELRHPSFDDPAVNALLAAHNVARVIADTADNPHRTLTADFAYCRLQGPAHDAAKGYQPADIASWAETMGRWRAAGMVVVADLVHEDKLHAAGDAIALRVSIGLTPPGA